MNIYGKKKNLQTWAFQITSFFVSFSFFFIPPTQPFFFSDVPYLRKVKNKNYSMHPSEFGSNRARVPPIDRNSGIDGIS